ncbi:MAG TPA: lamin tail domain-containing protein [Verrucomicrobiales bacterium]|nr:lamin tail domain-containing protein [Verrucomicrobiales bacterium]
MKRNLNVLLPGVLALAAIAAAPVHAAVLVNLDATGLPTGALPVWTNTGTLPGNFTSGATVPQVTLTTPGAGGGNAVNAVRFIGSATYYGGPIAPNSIGGQGARSIEVWAMNPATVDEETMVAWGHRGGPAGTNMSFNWGHHGTWGAVGHWDAPDMPWAPQPVPNQWHHLVYTYDSTTVRLYVDGQPNNVRALTLNTWQGFNITIAGQNANTPAGFNADMSIAKVKVHDTSLTLSEVRGSYNLDAAMFGKAVALETPVINSFTVSPSFALPGQPVTLSWNVGTSPAKPLTGISINNGAPAISGNTGTVQVTPSGVVNYTLTATNADGSVVASVVSLPRAQPLVPRHRWSFSNAAGTATNGAVIPDLIGGPSGDAFVRTNGVTNAQFSGTQVALPGGASGTAPYVDLPNGILSLRSGDATYEGWMTLSGIQNWSRIFDFGSSAAGELLLPGGTGNGNEYLLVSAMVGTNSAQNRMELRENNVATLIDMGVTYSAGTEFHFAVVYDMDGGSGGTQQARYYRNGQLLGSVDTGKFLSSILDNNNWLGRSNYTADNNTQGSYNEFRVYDGAMSVEDINASMTAGPDVAVLPTPLHLDLFAADPQVINPGGSTTLHWRATAPGGAATGSISPTVGALANALTGSVVVSPAATTTYTFSVTSGGQTRTATQRVVVAYVAPDTPVADSQSVAVPFQSARPIRLTATDPDDEALTWTIVTQPAHGSLTGTAPALTYTPTGTYTGPDSFTFKVNDGTLDSNTATVSLSVFPAIAPTDIVLSDTQIKTDDTVGTMIGRLSASDAGAPETHTYALVAGTGSTNNGDFTISGNQLISNRNFSAALNQPVSIRLRVTDQTGQSFERVFTFTVGAPDLHVKINEIFYNSPNNRIGAEFIELHNPFATAVDVSNWRLSEGVEYVFPPGSSIPAGGYLVVSQNPATVQSLWGATALGPWTGGLSSEGENIILRDALNNKVDEVEYGINTPWPVPPNGDGPSLELIHPSLDNDLGGNWKAATVNTMATSYVTRGAAGWRFRPGNSEASAPIGVWRTNGFVEDATWKTGTAPIGMFKVNNNASIPFFAETGVTLGTQLTAAVTGLPTDMATFVSAGTDSNANFTVNYPSVFFRRQFTVTGTPPKALFLRVMHNDAAIVYINGSEVARFGFPEGAPAEPPASYQAVYERGNDPWSELFLTNAAEYLTTGTNTLAIQGWGKFPRLRGAPNAQDDANLYNVFDFAIDAELSTAAQFKATPGAQNSVFTATGAGPAVRNVTHLPGQPTSGNPIVVSARISDRQGLGAVELRYQVVAPGAFIPAEEPRTTTDVLNNIVANPDYPRLPNAAFESPANWITVPMTDAGGTSGDTEGDGYFTGVIPPQGHRRLVRYRIFATDLAGNTTQYPAPDDPSRNFAAFVYNGLPGYTNGTFSTGPAELSTLPVYHWIMRSADFDRLMAYATDQYANNNALSTLLARRYYNFQGAMVYDGKVYDHVKVRLRGGNSRYMGAGKRHFRFKFPKGYAFEAKDNKGRRYPKDWEDMLFNKLFGNKGDYDWGLPYIAGEKLWGLQGVPMPFNHWVHFRVIRGANQAADGTNGNDFFGLYQALELPEGKNFLEARDLPKGNFYKMSDFIQNGEMDERYQAAGAPDFAEDFDNIRYNIHPSTTQADMEKFVNMPLWYKYNAVQEAIRHYDIFIEPTGRHRVKNLYWYFHPGALNPDGSRVNPLGQCWFMPYDWDASFGPNWNNGFDFVNNAIYIRNLVMDSPTWTGVIPDRTGMRIQHRNAYREFRDLVFHRNDAGGTGPVDYILDDAAAVLNLFWEADAARWPTTTVGAASWRSMPAKVADMKAFCFTGWSTIGGEPVVGAGGRAAYLDSISDPQDAGQLPATPTVNYTGTAGFPVDGLSFSASAFSDPQGGAFAGVQWRAGEIAPPTATEDRIYEATEVWGSGKLAGPGASVTIPPGALRAGHTYRVRVRYEDATGRMSHWSAPLEFTTGEGSYDRTLTENLYISEFMYKPAPPTAVQAGAPNFWTENDFEWVELTNRSTTLTLDLTNVRFTKGVDFNFAGSAVTSLAPGARVLVVQNAVAFTDRYGAGKPIAGQWDAGQSLSNGGEQLKLSYGAGAPIHDITYDDAAPWPADGDSGGVSLVYAGPNAVAGNADPQALGSNWVTGSISGGAPGLTDTYTFGAWMAAKGTSDPLGDADNDGWNNLATFAFARDLAPRTPQSVITTEGANRYVDFSYFRRQAALGVTFVHEASTSMANGSWSAANISVTGTTANGDGTETVRTRLLLPIDAPATGRHYYVRARAVVP